ncbi:MAG TPA: carboxypeptidase regulatory-like domain-containing protein [Gemmatimonadales bacterium]
MQSPILSATLATLVLIPLGSTTAQQRGARVEGAVTDAVSGRRLEGVAVIIAGDLVGATDSRGRFVVAAVPLGEHRVQVTRIGYRPKTLRLPIAPDDAGGRVFVDVMLEPLPVGLEAVVVRGDTTSLVAYGLYADFYRRRRMGMGGRFITARDIERRSPLQISDMFLTIPGAWLSYTAFGDRSFTFRSVAAGALRGRCAPAVFLDHVRMTGWLSLDDIVTPERVEGIEVYAGDLMVPLQFSGGCGAIVIWTR